MPKPFYPQNMIWIFLSLGVIALDQLSKTWMLSSMLFGESHSITSFFNLYLTQNFGAAFSFLSQENGWQSYFFIIAAFTASIALMIWLIRLSSKQKLLSFAIALLIGGALGNAWDRLVYGYVIDFIQLHWRDHAFPVFNIADCAITCGAILMAFAILFEHQEPGVIE